MTQDQKEKARMMSLTEEQPSDNTYQKAAKLVVRGAYLLACLEEQEQRLKYSKRRR